MDKLYHRTADSTDTPNSVDEMSGSKQEYKSNQAADKALKRMSVNLVKQLNLFDTVLNLHAMDGLTALEMEELTSFYKTELERKQYLVITVIPSKGQYKGMKLLMQALRQTEQYEVLSLLEKTYDEEVDAIIDNVGSIASPVEEQPQPQSGDVFSLKSSVTVEQQLQSQSDDVSPFESPEQQPHSQSDGVSSLAFPVIAEQPQSQSNSSASLNSPTQQQSQSQITPYFKFRLPPTYSGTVTFAVSPSSQSSTDDIPHSSNANGGDPPEQDRALNATPDHENFNNNNSDHDGAASNVTHDILRATDDYVVMKLVFVGDVATGKTSLLEQYLNNKFSNSKPATVIDFKCVVLTYCNTRYQVHLWDIAGQERYRALTSVYYRDAVGIFVVYDVTQRKSLEHCIQWKKEIDDAVGDEIPVVLIANKIDCGRLDGERFSKENGFAGYFETSAKTGAGEEVSPTTSVMCSRQDTALPLQVHELDSHAYQDSVVQTPRRDRTSSIKLHCNKCRSKRKCC